ATGSYDGSNAAAPSIAFNLDINDFTIAKTYQSFVSVQTLAPMAKYLNGKFSAKLSMTSPLDNTMTPDWNEFYSTGVLNIDKAQVEGFEPLNKVADAIKVDALRNPSLNKINPSFKVEHGKFILSPFTFAVLNNDVTFSGTTGMDKSIDYNMAVAIPAGNLQKAGNEAISKLLKRDVSAIKSSKITVTTVVRGTIDNPMVHSVGSSAAEEATQTVKEEVTKEVEAKIEEKKQEVQQQVEQKTEEIKKQAEDKVKEEAKKKLKGLFKK
ncbi:MAG TPA: AsmA-like C-terminal region-containing protein, partial [Ignavibacteriales bacterium]|nr:AsmA-like C-terminal region-containing protein [Ignavibacteriales bacterium]